MFLLGNSSGALRSIRSVDFGWVGMKQRNFFDSRQMFTIIFSAHSEKGAVVGHCYSDF